MKQGKYYLRIKKNGKEKDAIVKAHSIQTVINSFREHNVAIVEHFQVADDVNTVEEALESIKKVAPVVS